MLQTAHPLTVILILINVLVTYKGLNDYGFFERYKFNAGAVSRGEYYRLVTGAFLHAGWWHLLANMFTLWFFMPVVEDAFGIPGALTIYVASLLGGNLLAYYFHKGQGWYSAVGNSGAVNGILFSSIMLYPSMSLIILPVPIPIPAPVYAIAYLLYTTYGMRHQRGNIGHEAHFGGAALGMVFTALLDPSIIVRQALLSLILAIVIIGGFVWTRRQNY